MLLNCGVGEDSWESLGLQGDQASQSEGKSALNIHWKDCCWSWRSNPLATWCKELTHCKRPWWWERLKAGGEGDDRGWDGWMASPTQCTWVWVNSRSWWWTGRPGMLQSMGSQGIRHDSVQFSCSVMYDSATPWTTARQASLSITNSWSLHKLMSIKSVMPSNHLILYRPLLLLPSIFPSTRVFSNESVLHIRWPNYWSFSFNISPSNEHPGVISFRMDWLDLLEVQGTLKSLLQHHSSKASILQCSAFFIVQLSHPYMTLEKP